MHGSCKVHDRCVDGCLPFRLTLSALQRHPSGLPQILTVVHTYKFSKFLEPVLESLTTKNGTVNGSLNFFTECID